MILKYDSVIACLRNSDDFPESGMQTQIQSSSNLNL
jgi:hypothetical protein